MGKTTEIRNSALWTTVMLYGIGLAVLVFVLKYFEYKYWIRDLSVELYIGVVAILFTALGIWVGSKLLQQKKKAADIDVGHTKTRHTVNDTAIQSLGISARELEVLQLIAKGNSNQEIADKLFISLATVKSHSSSLFSKLDVRRRTQAVHKAKALGIIG